jgi:hypothetical protein
MAEFAFQFRMELLHFSPTIWRRIVVPSTYTFWDLHVAIQDAMGWKDTHLHLFRLVGTEDTYGIPSEDGDDMFPVLAGWETLIENHFDHMRPLALYEYDFGDGWLHSVLFETVEQRDPSVKLPVCTGGERHCPPEDCGGVDGYRDVLATLADKGHPEHASVRRWVGPRFDPEKFDPQRVKFMDPRRRLRRMLEG